MNNVEEFNDNLFFVFEKLLMDKELAEKFAECKTEDELYNFCLKIKGGYTKEEWEKFAEIIYKLTINKENDKILLDNDLEEIGGGSMTNNIGKKALSGTLAALTAATVLQVGSVGASAASSSPKPKTSVSQRSSSPRWKKIIRGVLIGAGVAAVAAALGYGAYRFVKHKKNDTPKNQPKPNVDQSRIGVKKDQTLGIKNFGNSCYLNAVIQQITSDPGLRKRILDDRVDNHPGQEKLFAAIQKLVKCAVNGRHGIEMDEDDLAKLEKLAESAGLYDTGQQDAHEYLGDILKKLYPEQADSIPSPIRIPGNSGETVSLKNMIEYGGKFNNDRACIILGKRPGIQGAHSEWVEQCKKIIDNNGKCGKCGKLKNCEHYRAYEASIDKKSSFKYFLQTLISDMSDEEDFSSHDPLKRKREDGKVLDGEFRLSAGNRVYIPINRFGQDIETGRIFRKDNFIEVPETLEIDSEKYKFVGSILHRGNSLNSGHYLSITSSDGENFELFNDSIVTRIKESEALKLTGEDVALVVYQLI